VAVFREPVFDESGVFEQNQAMQCAQHLVRRWGFERVMYDLFGYEVDDQHALLINVESTDFMSRGDTPDSFSLFFSIARRDINEFLIEWDTASTRQEPGWKRSTISSLGTDFFPGQSFRWKRDVSFDECADQIDWAIEEFDQWADLGKIESALYRSDPPYLPHARAALANSALNGDDRADDLWERFMEFQVAGREPLRSRAQLYFDNTQAYRSQHPKGVKRS